MSVHLDDVRAQAFVDRALPAEEHACCQEHLACCDDCTRLVSSYRALAEALEGLEPLPAPPDFTTSVMCCIETVEHGRAWNRRIGFAIFGVALAVSAALLATAGAGAWATEITGLASFLGNAAAVLRVAGDVLGPLASAFRVQIGIAASFVAVALLLSLSRLVPRRGEAVA